MKKLIASALGIALGLTATVATAQWGRDRDDEWDRGRGRGDEIDRAFQNASNYANRLGASCRIDRQYGPRGRLAYITLSCNLRRGRY